VAVGPEKAQLTFSVSWDATTHLSSPVVAPGREWFTSFANNC
jgi:hypothetical protein